MMGHLSGQASMTSASGHVAALCKHVPVDPGIPAPDYNTTCLSTLEQGKIKIVHSQSEQRTS